MLTDTLLSPQKCLDNKTIPSGFLPKQYEVETFIYCTLKLDDDVPALLLIKPVVLEANNTKHYRDEWSAYSLKVTSSHSFKSKNYGDLFNEMSEEIIPPIQAAETAYSELVFHVDMGSSVETEQLGANEIHLRASPHNLSWTAYRSKFLVATALENSGSVFEKLDKHHALMPLDESLSEILGSGHYKGCRLTDDLVQTLKDPAKLKYLQEHAL